MSPLASGSNIVVISFSVTILDSGVENRIFGYIRNLG